MDIVPNFFKNQLKPIWAVSDISDGDYRTSPVWQDNHQTPHRFLYKGLPLSTQKSLATEVTRPSVKLVFYWQKLHLGGLVW